MFLKTPNTIAGPGSEVKLPTEKTLFEEELAVIVGQRCRNLSPDEAMDAVAGYTAADDLMNDADENTVLRKSFDNACPLGPCIVTPEEVPDDAEITVRVKGDL